MNMFIFCGLVNFAAPLLVSGLSIIPSSLHAPSYAVFFCRRGAAGSSALSWRDPNGVVIENSERTKITDYRHGSELNITQLRASDSGEYTCTDGSENSSANLVVRIYPSITYAPTVQNFTEGQEACIICTVDLGTPPGYSSVWWMGPSSNALFPTLNTSTCVCIQRIAARDGGLYQCVVDADGYSSVSRSIEVYVLPSPYPDPPSESPTEQAVASNAGASTPVYVPVPTPLQKMATNISQLENREKTRILIVHVSMCHPALVHFITWHIEKYMSENCSCSVVIVNDTLQCTGEGTGVYSFEFTGPGAQSLSSTLVASISSGQFEVPTLDFRISVRKDESQYLSHTICIITGMGMICVASVCMICFGTIFCVLQKRGKKSRSIECSLMNLPISNDNWECPCQSPYGPQQRPLSQCSSGGDGGGGGGAGSCAHLSVLQTLQASIESSDSPSSSFT